MIVHLPGFMPAGQFYEGFKLIRPIQAHSVFIRFQKMIVFYPHLTPLFLRAE